jgi:hypothetical protein
MSGSTTYSPLLIPEKLQTFDSDHSVMRTVNRLSRMRVN